MSRYIDAERFDVFDAVKPEQYDTESFMAGMEVVLDAIKDAPTIEPKQGEWIYCEDNGQDGYRCSECGLFVPWCYEYHDINFILDYQACPYCLTRMKGADDETD